MDEGMNDTPLMIISLALGVTILLGLLFIHVYDPDLNDAMYDMRDVIMNVVDPFGHGGIMPH